MGYRKEVVKGVSWIGFLRFATKAIGFIETIVLAHILIPSQFGAYGIALLTLGLLEVISETGVNIFLIQEETIDEYINSAWIVSILRGIIISGTLYILSPVISNFFHSPDSLFLLRMISIAPLIRGFINPAVVSFQKKLLFVKDFSYQFVILIIDTCVSITVCFITKSPIGIATGLIAGVLVELLLSFLVVSPRPRMEFKKGYVQKIFHGGKWVTVGGIFDYLFENADNIVVGRMLGATSLGIYQTAYSLAVIPLNEVGKVFVHVTTPVMVKFPDDKKRLRSAFLQSLVSVFALVFPIVILLTLFPKLFVLILGQRWLKIESVIPVLALLGFVRSLSGTSSALFLSLKKQNITMYAMFIATGGLILCIVPLVNKFGIIGAGLSALIGSILAVPFIIYNVRRILKYE